jgi:deazaflavin-dependent oxidoreductase (nitroreductase family)
MSSKKAPGAFPPPGTLKARLVNLIPRANVLVYRWSDGRIGGRIEELPVLILHTVGRKSGRARQSPLLHLRDGDDYVVVGSRGGSDAPPAWWLNLQATPAATVEIEGVRQPVSARRATAEEKAGLWPRLAAGYPFYDDYQARTTREIPVIVLSPSEGRGDEFPARAGSKQT